MIKHLRDLTQRFLQADIVQDDYKAQVIARLQETESMFDWSDFAMMVRRSKE